MNKMILTLLFVISSSFMLASCTNEQVGTATGAAAGAGIGYAVSNGSALGTVIGAGAGGLIGNAIGRDQDRREYYDDDYYY